MRFFFANDDYISYLSENIDNVMFNKNHSRPYLFCVVSIVSKSYAIPMTSPKTAKKYNSFTMHYVNGRDDELGRILINNMIPYDESLFYEVLDNNFECDQSYLSLLMIQEREILREIDTINRKVNKVYKNRINCNSKMFPFLEKVCVDFEEAERVMDKFIELYRPENNYSSKER